MKKIVTVISALLIHITSAYSQAGTLDATFDGDGIVTTPVGSSYEGAYAMLIQPDGKIVAAGYANTGTNYFFDYDFALIRYNTDGSLDASFGSGGKVTTDFASIGDFGLSAAIQPDGKILIGGETYVNENYNEGFALARYNTDGTLDNSFSADGKVIIDFGSGDDVSFKVAVQPDGKILLAGHAFSGTQNKFALVRLDSSGTIDNSFGTNGKVTFAVGNTNDRIHDLELLPDGKIIAAGRAANGSDYDFALARFNSNGSIDNTFGVNGKVTTDIANADDYGNAMALQPDGSILVSGYTGDILSITKFAMVRYDSLGSIDNTFGTNGRVTTALTNHDESYSMTLQPDNKILLAGRSFNGSNNDFGIARYKMDGSPDSSFDDDGMVTISLSNGHDEAYEVAMQQDGKIVIAGRAEFTTDDFAVIRIFSGVATEVVNSQPSPESLFIYPNPSRGIFSVQLKDCSENYKVDVLNPEGRNVYSARLSFLENKIDASNLPDGIYFLKIKIGEIDIIEKIVKY